MILDVRVAIYWLADNSGPVMMIRLFQISLISVISLISLISLIIIRAPRERERNNNKLLLRALCRAERAGQIRKGQRERWRKKLGYSELA